MYVLCNKSIKKEKDESQALKRVEDMTSEWSGRKAQWLLAVGLPWDLAGLTATKTSCTRTWPTDGGTRVSTAMRVQ